MVFWGAVKETHEEKWARLSVAVEKRANLSWNLAKEYFNVTHTPAQSFRNMVDMLCAPTELPKGLSDYAKQRRMSVQQVMDEAVAGMKVDGLDPSKQFNIAVIGHKGRP